MDYTLTLQSYHWALLVGPKSETTESKGYRFHAKQELASLGNPPVTQWVWRYDESEITMMPTMMQLVRVMVGKVKTLNRLRSTFGSIPVRPEIQGWNCVEWVKEALTAAIQDGRALGTSAGGWPKVRDTAMRYVESKKEAHRFDGTVEYSRDKVPTWDLLSNVELIP